MADYIRALARVFVVENLSAWSPSIRSRSILRTAEKRHFVDSSLAMAALGLSLDRVVLDTATMVFLFECLAIHGLRIYAQALDEARIYCYADNPDSRPTRSWSTAMGGGQRSR